MGKLDVLNQSFNADGMSSLDESQYANARNISMKKYNSTFNLKKRSSSKERNSVFPVQMDPGNAYLVVDLLKSQKANMTQ